MSFRYNSAVGNHKVHTIMPYSFACGLGIDEFGKYEHLLRSDATANFEKDEVNNILSGKADYVTYLKGLKTLTKYIYKHPLELNLGGCFVVEYQ